jgi:DNA anti-recombination protein RmuC
MTLNVRFTVDPLTIRLDPIQLTSAVSILRSALTDISHHLDRLEKTMGVLDDKLNKVQADLAAGRAAIDSLATRVSTDMANLSQQITDLKTQVESGAASQAVLDQLDQIDATVTGLKDAADAIDPANPQPVPPGS